jgi:hypothetical protein
MHPNFAAISGGCAPCRGRSRQRDRQRIAAQHHHHYQPPNRALTVSFGAKKLGDVADGSILRLDLPTFGAQSGRSALKSARALPSRWRCATSTSRVLRRASMAVRAVVVRPRLAAPSIVESIWPSRVEVGNGVGRNLDPGGKSRVMHLDRRCSRTTLSYMGGDDLSIDAGRIDDGKCRQQHSKG